MVPEFIFHEFPNLPPGDGTVGINEFRQDCVQRMAYKTIEELDAAYEKLVTVSYPVSSSNENTYLWQPKLPSKIELGYPE